MVEYMKFRSFPEFPVMSIHTVNFNFEKSVQSEHFFSFLSAMRYFMSRREGLLRLDMIFKPDSCFVPPHHHSCHRILCNNPGDCDPPRTRSTTQIEDLLALPVSCVYIYVPEEHQHPHLSTAAVLLLPTFFPTRATPTR